MTSVPAAWEPFELAVFDCDGVLVGQTGLLRRFFGRIFSSTEAAGMHAFAYAGGVTPAERLAGPGTTAFHDMRQLPELIAAGRTVG